MNNKKNYITKHSIARSIVSLLIMTMAAFAIVACTEKDFLGGHQSTGELQTATFEIAILPSEVAQRTRAALGEAEIDTKVSHVWIGIFYEDGKLLRAEEFLTDGKWEKPTASGAHDALIWDGKVDMSVMYPDSKDKPLSKVFVAGIANYKGVDAYDGATDTKTKMEDLLAKVEKWEDYQQISVDVQSAEEMAVTNGRIMSNLVSFDDGHYNFTIDAPTQKFSNPDKCLFQLQDRSRDRIAGSLHLRRMIAHNVVNITPGENVELSNIRYKVFNLPLRTYVQERTMNGYKKTEWGAYDTWEKWFEQSPNAADYFPENKSIYYTDYEEAIAEQTSAGYSFDFLQYDNKHWAVKKDDGESVEICDQYIDREKLLDNNNGNQLLYKSLCLTEDYWFNNYASYFQIYATVTDKNTGVTADVTYTIHEGGANDADLTELKTSGWTGKRSRDFMCVRNTEYTYKVNITGLNSFTVDVDANPGVSGLAKAVTFETGSEGSEEEVTAELYLTDAQRANLVYRIYQPAPPSLTRATDVADFGTFNPDLFEDMESLSSEWKDDSGYNQTEDEENDFYKGVIFYDYDESTELETEIGTFDKFTQVNGLTDNNKLKKYIVKVKAEYNAVCPYNQRDEYARFFYCYPEDAVYENETRKYQPLIIIKQYPRLPKLSLPTIGSIEKFENSIGTAEPVAIANYVNSVTVNLQEESFGVENGETTVATTYYISIDDGQQIEATKNGMALTAALPGLPAGMHTLTVSATHDLYYGPSDKSEAVEFYVYPTKMKWNPTQLTAIPDDKIYYGDSKYEGTDHSVDEYYGLKLGDGITLETNNNTKCFYTPGAYSETGNNSGRYIKFTALYDGVVTVRTSSTDKNNNADNRKIVVKDAIGKQLQSGGAISTSSYTRKFNVTKGDIMIYSSNSGLYFYEITFEYAPFVRHWDFTNWSADTKANLAAGADWSDDEKGDETNVTNGNCFWQVGSSDSNGETLTANGKIIEELGGLRFINNKARALAIAVNYPSTSLGTYQGGQYLWLGNSGTNYFIIPNVAPGSTIEMGVESHSASEARGVKLYVSDSGTPGDELKGTDGSEVAVPTTYKVQTWLVPEGSDNVDIIVSNTKGCHIYYIDVKR